MDKLPKEIITTILKNLPQKDLLNAARVNKNFNEIITAFRLIPKIFITTKTIENPPTRFYRTAVINKDNSVNFCKALEAIGEGVDEIYFNNLTSSLKSITTILNFLPNVKVISFYYTRIENEDEEFEENVQSLNGVKLIFRESNPVIFKALKQVGIKSIEMNFYGDTPYYNFKDILPFMKNQKQLKSFAMSGIYESNLMYGIVPRGDFKLTEFSISASDLEEWHYLEGFLTDHVDALEKLTISGISSWDSSNVINSCKSLKSLTMHETLLDELNDTILSVEELSIKLPMQNITMFPNVIKLYIEQSNVASNQNLSQAMHKVTDLTVKFGPASGILMPNVTKLELMNVNQLEPGFFIQHNKLETLILRNVFELNDNLLQAIAESSGYSLKVLRIFGLNNLTGRAFEILKENCKSLKIFEMATWSQQFKNDEWKSLYEINGLKIFTEKFDF